MHAFLNMCIFLGEAIIAKFSWIIKKERLLSSHSRHFKGFYCMLVISRIQGLSLFSISCWWQTKKCCDFMKGFLFIKYVYITACDFIVLYVTC